MEDPKCTFKYAVLFSEYNIQWLIIHSVIMGIYGDVKFDKFFNQNNITPFQFVQIQISASWARTFLPKSWIYTCSVKSTVINVTTRKRSCGKVMFSQASVCSQRGVCSGGVCLGGVCLEGVSVQGVYTPPLPIRSTGLRNASYWNAYLLK